jgi:hypothetical protein
MSVADKCIHFLNAAARKLLSIIDRLETGRRVCRAIRIPVVLDLIGDTLRTPHFQTLEFRIPRGWFSDQNSVFSFVGGKRSIRCRFGKLSLKLSGKTLVHQLPVYEDGVWAGSGERKPGSITAGAM